MKKIKLYALAAAVLAFGLAGCTKEKPTGGEGPVYGVNGGAYVSVQIAAQKQTRASTEASGPENAINSIYLITFAANNTLVAIPNGGGNFIRLTGDAAITSPEAQLISGDATNMVVVVNPGPKMVAKLGALGSGVAYSVFNQAVQDATAADLANGDGSTGYTMISTKRDYTVDPLTPMGIGETIDNAYINIVGRMVPIATTPEAAKQEAETAAKRVNVLMERLTSKLMFREKPAADGGVTVPEGVTFGFGNWTVDAVNSRYFPFAVKTMLSANHTPTPGYYYNNFYTEDPNYGVIANIGDALASGIMFAEIGADYVPVLPWGNYYGWKASGALAYAVENTMGGVSNGQAAAQQFGNATRIIFKGTYIPKGMSTAAGERDWFQFAGINYDNLAALKAKYALGTDTGFEAACDAFAAKISGGTVAFAALTEANLTAFGTSNQIGGELAKVPEDGVGIRWFQNGLNYWYYEIKHNNDENGFMAYGKYGIVRNNQYNMTLGSVTHEGTPWYPDLRDPGDGDPKPEDPIDKTTGYVGVEIEVADWILWEADIVI